MQTAGNFVTATAEFSARVELGENHLDRGFAFFFDYTRRNTSSVIGDADCAVFQNLDDDVRAITGKSLVDGIVHDFRNQMVQTSRVRRTDVHTRAFSDRIESFQNLYVARIITVFDFFCHLSS